MDRQIVGQALLSLAIGGAGALAFSQVVEGTPEISQKEQQGCLVCHTAVGKADLSDRGRYYRAEGTLDGYEVPPSPERTESEDPESGDTGRPDPSPDNRFRSRR